MSVILKLTEVQADWRDGFVTLRLEAIVPVGQGNALHDLMLNHSIVEDWVLSRYTPPAISTIEATPQMVDTW
jgi:hypothetical protein